MLQLSPRSRRVMSISGLLKIFQAFESEEEGVRSFASNG
jgi:anti-anti-sigma regulatory factor